MHNEKSLWIQRFSTRLMVLDPHVQTGLLPEIAETFWYYQRHRQPEECAQARADGRLRMPGRRDAWIEACAAAIRALDPELGSQDTTALATTLWEEDWARTVDPYLMAQALWEQALLLASQSDNPGERVPSLHAVLRNPDL
jgi:hypothetical protein